RPDPDRARPPARSHPPGPAARGPRSRRGAARPRAPAPRRRASRSGRRRSLGRSTRRRTTGASGRAAFRAWSRGRSVSPISRQAHRPKPACPARRTALRRVPMAVALAEVVALLEELAPLRFAEPWDNVGLLIDPPLPDGEIQRALLTIDLTHRSEERRVGKDER